MRVEQFESFSGMLSELMAYYKSDLSEFKLTVWWEACKGFDYEVVQRVIHRHVADPERGRFEPKVADMVAMLQGTHSDRAQVAWGKALEAMQSVGAYTDVVFDDPVIHAVIEDLGGWPKVCRTPTDELGYVQTAFGKSYRAYAAMERFDYPRRLGGDRSPDSEYERKGLKIPMALVGVESRCQQVLALGSQSGKTAITGTTVQAMLAQGLRRRIEPPQDTHYHGTPAIERGRA